MGRSCQHRPTIDPASGENKRKLAVRRRCPPARPTCFVFPPRARSPSGPPPHRRHFRLHRDQLRPGPLGAAAGPLRRRRLPQPARLRPPPSVHHRAPNAPPPSSPANRSRGATRRRNFRPTRPAHRTIGPGTMPAGQFFRLGDKRDNRRGSHFFGFRPRAEIIGEATGGVVSATPTAGSARASVASSPSSTEPRHRLSSSPPRLPPGS